MPWLSSRSAVEVVQAIAALLILADRNVGDGQRRGRILGVVGHGIAPGLDFRTPFLAGWAGARNPKTRIGRTSSLHRSCIRHTPAHRKSGRRRPSHRRSDSNRWFFRGVSSTGAGCGDCNRGTLPETGKPRPSAGQTALCFGLDLWHGQALDLLGLPGCVENPDFWHDLLHKHPGF